MLKTRIVTAIVLVSAFLLALFYLPPIGWLAVSTLIAALAAWEWGGQDEPPVLHKEDLVYEFIELKQRSYK